MLGLALPDEIYGLKIVLIGKPCSGKGTQAPLMARKYRMIHLSTGASQRQRNYDMEIERL